MQSQNKQLFYVAGVVTSLLVTASTIAVTYGFENASEEVMSISFNFVLILLPFLILPTTATNQKRALLTLVLITIVFWSGSMVIARSLRGDMNFGLAFVLLLSPGLVVAAVILVERLIGSTFGSNK